MVYGILVGLVLSSLLLAVANKIEKISLDGDMPTGMAISLTLAALFKQAVGLAARMTFVVSACALVAKLIVDFA